jgi:hypothetical protein
VEREGANNSKKKSKEKATWKGAGQHPRITLHHALRQTGEARFKLTRNMARGTLQRQMKREKITTLTGWCLVRVVDISLVLKNEASKGAVCCQRAPHILCLFGLIFIGFYCTL